MIGIIYSEETERRRCTTARQPGSGRHLSARTVENVDTVNDLLLSPKGALKCIKPSVKLQGRPAFITRQCIASFNRIFIQLKCLKKRRAQELVSLRQLCTLVRLAARVTRSTQIRCGGKCNKCFVANLFLRVIAENFEKLVHE